VQDYGTQIKLDALLPDAMRQLLRRGGDA